MEKIIYVVDKKGSAIHIAASSRVALTGGRIFVANEYISPCRLLEDIYKEKSGIILFCWRKAFADIISLNTSIQLYNEIKNKFTFAFLIPDHIGLETEFEKTEERIIMVSDYYVVTSEILFNQYYEKYPAKPPKLVFHDLPNLKLIDDIRNEFSKSKNLKTKVIWVGNSKWGHRQGYIDHKGLVDYFKPLQNYCEINKLNFTFEIIDSSVKNLSQIETLKKIRDSDILLQISNNEGTGIVVLEAIALDTHVLTTKVGIAGELFSDSDYQLVFDKSVSGLITKIEQLLENGSLEYARKKYEEHIENARFENLTWVAKYKESIELTPIGTNFLVSVYWFYRYILNKFSS